MDYSKLCSSLIALHDIKYYQEMYVCSKHAMSRQSMIINSIYDKINDIEDDEFIRNSYSVDYLYDEIQECQLEKDKIKKENNIYEIKLEYLTKSFIKNELSIYISTSDLHFLIMDYIY